jgi:hypothetical protein
MPRPELPHVRPFTVQELGLEFTERRDCTPEEDDAARQGFRKWTIAGWNEKQPQPRRDCNDAPSIRLEIARRWGEWITDNPGGTRDEFEQLGLTVIDETCDDPRLPQVNLCARVGGVVVGMASLFNIEKIGRYDGALVVRAMPMPGFPPGGRGHIPEAWGVFSRYILENDLEFVDGTKLEVAELRFPDNDDSDSIPRQGNGMAQMWDEILRAANVVEVSDRDGVTPSRVEAKIWGSSRPGREAYSWE